MVSNDITTAATRTKSGRAVPAPASFSSREGVTPPPPAGFLPRSPAFGLTAISPRSPGARPRVRFLELAAAARERLNPGLAPQPGARTPHRPVRTCRDVLLDQYVLVRVDRVYPIVDTEIDRVYPIVAPTTAILFTRRKTLGLTAFLWKTPRPRGPRPLRAPRCHATGRPAKNPPSAGRTPASGPPRPRYSPFQTYTRIAFTPAGVKALRAYSASLRPSG